MGRSHTPRGNSACVSQLLCLHAAITEARGTLEPMAHSRRVTAVRSLCTPTKSRPPLAAAREKAALGKEDPVKPKINNKIFKKDIRVGLAVELVNV